MHNLFDTTVSFEEIEQALNKIKKTLNQTKLKYGYASECSQARKMLFSVSKSIMTLRKELLERRKLRRHLEKEELSNIKKQEKEAQKLVISEEEETHPVQDNNYLYLDEL